jgi:hypothetical protein
MALGNWSGDLKEYLTNAYYTTIDRDPFEWSYEKNDAGEIHEYIGSPVPFNDDVEVNLNVKLILGPRWPLKANKCGQDIPGLEIPTVECSLPPFQKGNIKYEVGEQVMTVINLLDWNEDDNDGQPSPLASSKGWVDVETNYGVIINREINGTKVTSNGLPMSEDFDLAVYIKGDRKPTAIYNAHLEITYEDLGAAGILCKNLGIPKISDK